MAHTNYGKADFEAWWREITEAALFPSLGPILNYIREQARNRNIHTAADLAVFLKGHKATILSMIDSWSDEHKDEVLQRVSYLFWEDWGLKQRVKPLEAQISKVKTSLMDSLGWWNIGAVVWIAKWVPRVAILGKKLKKATLRTKEESRDYYIHLISGTIMRRFLSEERNIEEWMNTLAKEIELDDELLRAVTTLIKRNEWDTFSEKEINDIYLNGRHEALWQIHWFSIWEKIL